uniref:Uncharacterized protein n=1 Tax=Anguilla anguilla TaxID=7936 RepID=A0A0E9R337_ANGAN
MHCSDRGSKLIFSNKNVLKKKKNSLVFTAFICALHTIRLIKQFISAGSSEELILHC